MRVEGGPAGRLTVFYTALYRSLLFPRTWHEIDPGGRVIHASPYVTMSMWVPWSPISACGMPIARIYHFTFLLYPKRGNTILQGLINAYREGG